MAQNPDQFYSVIRENNLPQLKALLGQKSDAAVADSRGITPLMYAAEIGSLDAMRLLIDRGADVNAQNAFGSTALMWSVSDPAKVRLLLDHGAQVNTAARSGRTALIIAAFTNPSAEVVRLLLAKGAKVDVMDQRHVTPLNAATFGNDTATVRLLLDAGADMDTPDTFIGLTPLMNAAGNRNVEAVKLLIAKGAKVNAVSKTEGLPKIQTGTVEFGGWTPLLFCFWGGGSFSVRPRPRMLFYRADAIIHKDWGANAPPPNVDATVLRPVTVQVGWPLNPTTGTPVGNNTTSFTFYVRRP